MIYYDSHRWSTLLRLHGSVLPKAMIWAIPSAFLCLALKWLEQDEYISLEALHVLSEGNIYSGFTYVLGVSLVFRTSQAYTRYWTACTSMHEMASEWSDACASLIAFVSVSKAPEREILKFRHTVVRLFSLLHGMALNELSQTEKDMPILDVDGLSKQQLGLLASHSAQGKTVQIVLCWIKAYVTRMDSEKVLTVPPPLLTRVFQELGVGLRNFHAAHQVGVWPFPFPYTQLTVMLIQFYTVMTPLVISTWRTHYVVCTVFCFISVTCMVGLDLIANELEDPFGDDPNDLPLVELQGDMNKFLTMQLHHMINQPPELTDNAILDPKRMVTEEVDSMGRRSKMKLELSTLTTKTKERLKAQRTSITNRRDRLDKQLKWRGSAPKYNQANNVRKVLKLNNPMGPAQSVTSGVSGAMSLASGASVPICPSTMGDLESPRSAVPELIVDGRASSDCSLDWDSPAAEHVQSLTTATPASLAATTALATPAHPAADPVDVAAVVLRSRKRSRCPSLRSQQSVLSQDPDRGGAGHGGGEGGLPEKPSQWNRFLDALQGELKDHLESRIDVQQKELGTMENLLRLLLKEDGGRQGVEQKVLLLQQSRLSERKEAKEIKREHQPALLACQQGPLNSVL